MSDLQNPLFDEEKEFLERKKLEYERALRGDVDHIKGQSVVVGKVALVGAGLAGSIWLISKAFGSKKRKRKTKNSQDNNYNPGSNDKGHRQDEFDSDDSNSFGADNSIGAEYYTAGNGKRYKSITHGKSAQASAQAFVEQDRREPGDEADDLGFGSKAAAQPEPAAGRRHQAHEPLPHDTEDFEDDPFQDLPYDDSRRLAPSHAFDHKNGLSSSPLPRQPNVLAGVLQAFLKSDTGKVLVAQVAAVVLAMVTKKVSEFFPADKNADLATSTAPVPSETGFSPAVSPVSPASPDAFTHSASL